jgi:hypothetical protein
MRDAADSHTRPRLAICLLVSGALWSFVASTTSRHHHGGSQGVVVSYLLDYVAFLLES